MSCVFVDGRTKTKADCSQSLLSATMKNLNGVDFSCRL